jgi:hypothetical protein
MWLRDLGAEGFPCDNFGALGRTHPSNEGLVIFRHILMLFFLTSGAINKERGRRNRSWCSKASMVQQLVYTFSCLIHLSGCVPTHLEEVPHHCSQFLALRPFLAAARINFRRVDNRCGFFMEILEHIFLLLVALGG